MSERGPGLTDLDGAARYARECRDAGRRVIFANGCFDLLHGGHVSYLEGARAAGDTLIVGINSDESVRRLKGPERPVVNQNERAELLSAMSCVDAVLVFDEPDCERMLRAIVPHVHAKGTDYTVDTVPEREIARELGIEVAIAGEAKQNNSSEIIGRLREETPGR